MDSMFRGTAFIFLMTFVQQPVKFGVGLKFKIDVLNSRLKSKTSSIWVRIRYNLGCSFSSDDNCFLSFLGKLMCT